MRHPACLLAILLAAACTEPAATTTTNDELLGLTKVNVVVTLDGSRTPTAIASTIRTLGGRTTSFARLPMVGAKLSPALLATVRALPGVRGVYLDRQLEPLLAQSRGTINADDVEAMGFNGSGVGVAVLDSGIDGTHGDLTYPSKTVQNIKIVADPSDLLGVDLLGQDLIVENLPDTDTTTGHGTHCAGIIGGSGPNYRGVAPGASLVGLGTGDGLSILWAIAGIDWILAHRAQYNIQVVSNSWGTTGAFDPNDPINTATKALHDTGITVVFASGNEGSAQDTLNPYSVAPWVIGVAAGCKLGSDPTNSAVDCNDGRSHMLADFSSRGIPGDATYHPTITAPGVRIVSTRAKTGTVLNALDAPSDVQDCAISTNNLPNYTCSSGTSMATPHIAGVVALMQDKANGTLSPDQIKAILTSTATPLAGYAQWEVGAGYVNALAAVNAVP